MANKLQKISAVAYVPGTPGVAGDPGQPYIPAYTEWKTKTQCGYVWPYGSTYVFDSAQGIWVEVPLDQYGNLQSGTSVISQVYKCETIRYPVYHAAQPYIAPTPSIPAIPSQYIYDNNLGWNSGARSIATLTNDGYAEFTVPPISTGVFVGLNDANEGASYAEINYAFYVAHGYLNIYELGQQKAYVGTATDTDVLKIRRRQGVVTYLKNDVVLYTSTTKSTGSLFLDVSLYTAGDYIDNPAMASTSEAAITLPALESAGAELPYAQSAVTLPQLVATSYQFSGANITLPALTLQGSNKPYGDARITLAQFETVASSGAPAPSYAVSNGTVMLLTGAAHGLTGEIGGANVTLGALTSDSGGVTSTDVGAGTVAGNTTTITNGDGSTTVIVVVANGDGSTTTTTTTTETDGSYTVDIVTVFPDGTTTGTSSSYDSGDNLIEQVTQTGTTTTDGDTTTTVLEGSDGSTTIIETITSGGDTTTTTTVNDAGVTTVTAITETAGGSAYSNEYVWTSYGEATVTLPQFTSYGFDYFTAMIPDEAFVQSSVTARSNWAALPPELVVVMNSTGLVTAVVAVEVLFDADVMSTATADMSMVFASVLEVLMNSTANAGSFIPYYDGETTVWVVNLDTSASTRYEGFAFNSFAERDGVYYAAGDTGIYKLEGDTDAGSEISALVSLGKQNLDDDMLKRIDNVYVTAASDDTLQLTVTVEGQSYTYLARSNSPELKSQRIEVGKGLRANFFEFDIQNLNGAAFELSAMDVIAALSNRRI